MQAAPSPQKLSPQGEIVEAHWQALAKQRRFYTILSVGLLLVAVSASLWFANESNAGKFFDRIPYFFDFFKDMAPPQQTKHYHSGIDRNKHRCQHHMAISCRYRETLSHSDEAHYARLQLPAAQPPSTRFPDTPLSDTRVRNHPQQPPFAHQQSAGFFHQLQRWSVKRIAIRRAAIPP